MLLLNIYKNVCRSRVRHFGRYAVSQKSQGNKYHKLIYQEKKLLRCSTINYAHTRFYSDESNEQQNHTPIQLPPLTDDPIIAMPSLIKAMKSSYNLHLVLKRRLDPDFDMFEFVDGSKQAVEVISHALANEDYDTLDGLLANAVLVKLKNKISTLTEAQKALIPVRKDDIYGIFPYTIDVLYEGDDDRQRTFAEITMVFFSLKGLKEMKERGEMPPLQMGLMPEYQNKIYLSNYRFRRDYTDNNTEPWIVTMCNEMMLIAA